MAPHEEILVPFPAAPASLPLASQCKSTLLVSSIRSLRDHGHYARYEGLLDAAYRETVIQSIAGVWLPMAAAVAHYEACDALGLSPSEQVRMGLDVSAHIQRSTINTLVKLAAGSGVTPWLGLRHFQRFYERVFVGGGSQVVKLGPKDARIDIVAFPLARVPYFVNGYKGVIQGGSTLFAAKAYVTTVPALSSPTSVSFRIAWA